ncbi:MAG: glycosyltransferase family 39 protein [Chloroflexi bacterium]|nr:glycosyltransferase family 39 protein [Chloroflexota bacterium]MCL5274810.1 glycosyltransferase family 39 protein [Chloroflexota bacterium]
MNHTATNQSRQAIWTLLTALALLAVAVFVGREVYVRLIVPAAPLNFDEAAHSLPGYYILRDVLRLDARAFWGDTHIQTLWPPGFSYLQAPVLAVLGLSDNAARLFSYIALVLAVLMSLAVIWSIKPEYAPAAGLAAGLIALSAPGWLSLGGLALQETPVALVTFITFWCFLRALRTGRARWFVLTGCALFFLFLTKYNYAAFALASIGLVDLGERIRMARAEGRSGFVRRLFSARNIGAMAALYVPVLLGLVFWFFGGADVVSTEVKWRDFRFFVVNENSGYPFWSEQNLLFYVRATLDWLMPHPLLALAALLGAGWAVARIRHPGVMLLTLYFVLGFTLATLHQLKADRYVAPFFPSLWVLTGLGAADLLRLVIRDWRLGRRGQKSEVRSQTTEVRGQRREVRSQITDFGSQKREAGSEKLERNLQSSISNLQSPISNLSSPISNLQSLLPAAVFVLLLFAGAAASWVTWLPRLQPVWYGGVADSLREASQQIVAWQQPQRPVLIIGTFGELSPPLFEWRLRTQAAFANGNIQYDAPPGDGSQIERVQHWLQANPSAQVTLIEVDRQTVLYNTADMADKNAWRQDLVAQFSRIRGYTLVHTVTYPRGGLTIRYYLPE